eukprot:CAMPEP_0117443020 /NCGR_PEP_ID=MMETSP0759-20121206/4470_1 /TAXON_ID=63605 /ORGANISM="Percolomonas cosmopolitus, Strain WS" /LENGTH=329 /DNA_ID=CAMNT_0005234963 /DNA_START=417 /DNA_END=1406 /DNA_ORIENTATION=+
MSYKLAHTIKQENNASIFAIRYSPDNECILLGCSDGHLRVYDAHDGRHMYTWNTSGKKQIKLPVTSLRFRPFTQTRKNIVLVAGSGGIVQHWHITSGRCLHTITEPNNQVYAVDYRDDGKFFATAGKDAAVRVYDEATKSLVVTMKGGSGNSAGHANRVFTLKFAKNDPNILLSGGWDNTVQIWDKRKDTAVRRIFGPHICGDALDLDSNNTILTGSWRTDRQIQLWDFSTGKLMEEIKLPEDPNTKQRCSIYTACFNGDSDLIACGGSGSNEARVINRSNGKFVGELTGLDKAVYSATFSPDNAFLAVGGGDGNVYLMKRTGILSHER